MLEVVALVILLFAAISVAFIYNFSREGALAAEQSRKIELVKRELKIAEKKFFQGKIKKELFEALLDDLEEQLAMAELTLFRMRKSGEISVEGKTQELFDKITRPTRHRKAKISHLLLETEMLKSEMNLLEVKLLKREIRPSVFLRLVKERERKMIRHESELMGVIDETNEKSA
jgi:hypothetical protein